MARAAVGFTGSPSVRPQRGFWKQVRASCALVLTGDVNVTGSITSADIFYLVNHVFKGGPEPQPCAVAGDADCSGTCTSADIIHLVNLVFEGRFAPCDGSTGPLAAEC